jgi:hypothetical protein
MLSKHIEDKGDVLQQYGFECPGCGYYPKVNKWLLAKFVQAHEIDVYNKFCRDFKKSVDAGEIKVRRPKKKKRS